MDQLKKADNEADNTYSLGDSTADYMLICSENSFIAADSLRSALADLRDAYQLLRRLHALAKAEISNSKKEI